jgi:PAS domain S-box-containing protein
MKKTSTLIDSTSDIAHHQQEVEALLVGSQAVLSQTSFEITARTIFTTCKTLIGATGGYVALLSEDGKENVLIFRDVGSLPGSMDPALPMPIRGLQGEAHRLGRAVLDNDVAHSAWWGVLPVEPASLANVLFAPFMDDGRAVGLLGLANKPGGFTGHDADLAKKFADFIAIALRQNRGEKTLRESEARFRNLFELAADALWLHDKGRIIEVNQQACLSLGYAREELLQLQVSDIEVGLGPEKLASIWREDSHSTTSFIGLRRRKDGSTFPVEIRSSRFSLGGRNLRLAAARDITERQQKEQALAESENRFRELFNHMKSGVIIYEVRGFGEEIVIKDLNRGAEQIEGLNKEHLLGRDIREVDPESEVSGLFEVIRQAWWTGQPEHLPASFYQGGRSSGWREHFIYKLPSGEVVVIYDNVTATVLAEKALRESEERLRQLAEHIQAALWIATPEIDEMLYISPAYEKIWGRSCDSLYQSPKSFIDAIDPDDRDRVREVLDTHRLQKTSWTIAYRVIRPDGSTCWVEDCGFPVHDKQGNVHRFIGLATDITKRKRVENELRTAKAHLEYLFTASPAVIYSCEITPPHQASYISKNVVSLLGYDSREFLDDPALWQANIHPADSFGVSTAITILFECGQISLEYRFRRKDGTYLWIQDEMIIVKDDQGTPMEIVGFLINISRRKKAEEALRQSETQYRSLVENTLDGYIIYQSPAGNFLFLNQRMCELYGCTRRDGLLLSCRDLIVPQERDRFQHWVQSHLQQDNHVSVPQVFTLRRLDGGNFLAEVAVSRITYQGNPAIQVVVRDVSERERLRQQVQHAQKMQALGTMAAGIAHEIRSPLTVCSSAAQFILEDDLTPEFRRQCLEKMLSGITKASSIIENLLKFARSPEKVEAARMELRTVVNDTLALVTNQARLQNVSIKRSMPRAPVYFYGFTGLLPQAFMNLFLNAVNAMPDGGTLSVLLEITDHEAVITITDTGHGIAPSDLPYIFDPFYSNSKAGQGTGLGLSICQSIIRQHLGSIEVESTLGGGTNFLVRLPLTQPGMPPSGFLPDPF